MIGLCHTDIHMRDNDWGISDYPLLAGHEGVAHVTRVGSAVRNIRPDDRIAITWIRDSCRACDSCLAGRENICEDGYQGTFLSDSAGAWGRSKLHYNENGGCFSKIQRIEERFAIKIPDGVPSEIACPLLCGGGTVYEPICNYAGPNVKVGVAGVGGLGTAAIKLAKLRGCIIYALSTSPRKEEAALAAGACEFVNMLDQAQVDAHGGCLDVLLDTTPVESNMDKYMALLKINGTYVKVGIPAMSQQTFSYNFSSLIFQQKKIVGTVITGTRRMKDMLDLVAKNVDFMKDTDSWKTEHVPISQINEVMDKLVNRKNKGYRYVLEW